MAACLLRMLLVATLLLLACPSGGAGGLPGLAQSPLPGAEPASALTEAHAVPPVDEVASDAPFAEPEPVAVWVAPDASTEPAAADGHVPLPVALLEAAPAPRQTEAASQVVPLPRQAPVLGALGVGFGLVAVGVAAGYGFARMPLPVLPSRPSARRQTQFHLVTTRHEIVREPRAPLDLREHLMAAPLVVLLLALGAFNKK